MEERWEQPWDERSETPRRSHGVRANTARSIRSGHTLEPKVVFPHQRMQFPEAGLDNAAKWSVVDC